MNNFNNSKSKTDSFEFNSEFDFMTIFRTIFRRKRFIFSITSIVTFFSIIYAYRITPIWQGEFDIVIQKESEANTNILKSLPGLPEGLLDDGNADTQELILKSPSVLMPIFKDVEDYYENNNIKNNLTFNRWIKEEIEVEFVENSKVLKVKYSNKDKNHILKTLDKISAKYKNYSKINEDKNINNTLKYLKTLEKDLKIKSKKSTSELNKFSIDNGLGSIDGFVQLEENSIKLQLPKELANSANLDAIKTNQKVPSPGQRFKAQFIALESYETKYVDLSSKLKPNSKYLKSIKVNIDNLRESLKRPNEILIKYRKLYLTSKRHNNTLNQIRDNIQSLELKKYEKADPWTIISRPLIGEYPIYPIKKHIVLQGFLIAFLLSSIFIIFKEKLSGKMYDFDLTKESLDVDFIDTLISSNAYLTLEIVRKLFEEKRLKEDNSLGILNFTSLNFDDLVSVLDPNNFISTYEIDLNTSDLKVKDGTFLLINESGELKQKDIILINKFNNIHKSKFLGWLLYDKKN